MKEKNFLKLLFVFKFLVLLPSLAYSSSFQCEDLLIKETRLPKVKSLPFAWVVRHKGFYVLKFDSNESDIYSLKISAEINAGILSLKAYRAFSAKGQALQHETAFYLSDSPGLTLETSLRSSFMDQVLMALASLDQGGLLETKSYGLLKGERSRLLSHDISVTREYAVRYTDKYQGVRKGIESVRLDFVVGPSLEKSSLPKDLMFRRADLILQSLVESFGLNLSSEG